MIVRESIEMEPQINADERRLNALSLDNIDAAASEKDCKWHLNLLRKIGTDKNQSGIKQKPLVLIMDKFSATNLRLSAFICGLKLYNTKQPKFIIKLENYRLLFTNHTSEFKDVHLLLDLRG